MLFDGAAACSVTGRFGRDAYFEGPVGAPGTPVPLAAEDPALGPRGRLAGGCEPSLLLLLSCFKQYALENSFKIYIMTIAHRYWSLRSSLPDPSLCINTLGCVAFKYTKGRCSLLCKLLHQHDYF